MSEVADSKVPEIRFGEFSGEWQKQDLGNITTKIGSGKTPKGGKTVYVSSGIPLLRSQNILNDVVDFNGIVFISDKIDEEMSNSRVLKDDVLLNITGASIGRSAVYRSSKPANVNQHVCIIRANDESSPDFIQLNLTSSRGQKAIDSSQAGGGREGLNFQQIAKIGFQFPLLLEQEQIGAYFKSLDRMIGLHQRKHDKLVTLKQAMLQKMFPQDGATTPEIRFKGFEGDWERTNLGAISKTTIGEFVIQTKQNPSAPYPVFNGGRSHTGFYDEYNNEGDKILVSARGANAGFVNIVRQRYWAGNSCYSIALDEKKADLDFSFWFVKRNQYRFTKNQQAANIPAVSKRDVEDFDFSHPSLTEQIKIGTYFRKLDELITEHATQLEKLKNIKSACLEKMFV